MQQGKMVEESDFDAGWDGHCSQCNDYGHNLVDLPSAGVYLCEACITEAKYVQERK